MYFTLISCSRKLSPKRDRTSHVRLLFFHPDTHASRFSSRHAIFLKGVAEDPDNGINLTGPGLTFDTHSSNHPASNEMAPLKDLLNQDSTSSYLPSPSSDDERHNWSTLGRSSSGSSPSETSGSDDDSSGTLVCQWDSCGQRFSQPEILYDHLCQDHVGRKSQKNLQLNCHWGTCTAKTVKRDHITSHLRVHVPLKPFSCSTCNKKFKRPQDLKKHLKVHLEDEGIVKRKRGPKVGSKRVDKSHPRSEHVRLPSIAFDNFVTTEMSHYKPVYTPQLGERLQTLLPPPANPVSGAAAQQSISSNPMFTHGQLSGPQDIRSAVGFFSALSSDMTRRLPRLPQMSMSPSAAPVTARYPAVLQLPPIHTSMPYPVAPSSHTGAPFVSSRLDSHNRVPQFSTGDTFSVHQQSSGEAQEDSEDISALLSHLELGDNLDEEFIGTLEKVNAIKDYLICTLLEQEYSEVSSDPEQDELVAPIRASTTLSKYPTVVV